MNWKLLEHAYGNASNIPDLLSQLSSFPDETDHEAEPWCALWKHLYFEGAVFSASFAAVPEIVNTLKLAPEKATLSFFLYPLLIEITRQKENIQLDEEILPTYETAIAELGILAAQCIAKNKSPEIAQAATAAFALSAGLYKHAELLLEITAEDVDETIEWYLER